MLLTKQVFGILALAVGSTYGWLAPGEMKKLGDRNTEVKQASFQPPGWGWSAPPDNFSPTNPDGIPSCRNSNSLYCEKHMLGKVATGVQDGLILAADYCGHNEVRMKSDPSTLRTSDGYYVVGIDYRPPGMNNGKGVDPFPSQPMSPKTGQGWDFQGVRFGTRVVDYRGQIHYLIQYTFASIVGCNRAMAGVSGGDCVACPDVANCGGAVTVRSGVEGYYMCGGGWFSWTNENCFNDHRRLWRKGESIAIDNKICSIRGMCTGNTVSTEDVDCSGEEKRKVNKGASVKGSKVSECCISMLTIQMQAAAARGWASISSQNACETNTDGISRTWGGLSNLGQTLDSCLSKCEYDRDCKAIDFYSSSGWCNTFDAACTNPTMSGGQSYRLPQGAARGWELISSKYVCNSNTDGISRTWPPPGPRDLGDTGFTLDSCKILCQNDPDCKAIDFGPLLGSCNTFDAACTNPTWKYFGQSYKSIDLARQGAARGWASISSQNACETNTDGISRTWGGTGQTLDSCKVKCQNDPDCKAIDFYSSSGWCNTFDAACTNPTMSAGQSYKSMDLAKQKEEKRLQDKAALEKELQADKVREIEIRQEYWKAAGKASEEKKRLQDIADAKVREAEIQRLNVMVTQFTNAEAGFGDMGMFGLKAGDESESDSAVAASSATPEPNHEHERDPILVAVLVLAVVSLLSSIVLVLRGWNSAQTTANNADAAPAGERRFNGSFDDGKQMRKFSQADDFSSPRFSVSNI